MNQYSESDGEKLVMIGNGETAEIAYEYFKHDSPHTIVAFSVEEEYIESKSFRDLPVIPLEEIKSTYPPEDYSAFVAISSTKLNRLRTRLYNQIKELGYSLVSYVSSNAFVWHNVDIGENVFIFENNVIQYQSEVGDNVVIWSGNHIGHQSYIKDNCFITSHVVISGFCEIGEYSFLGVNATLGDNISVGEDCVIGAGAVVHEDLDGEKVYVGNPAEPLDKSSYETMNVDDTV